MSTSSPTVDPLITTEVQWALAIVIIFALFLGFLGCIACIGRSHINYKLERVWKKQLKKERETLTKPEEIAAWETKWRKLKHSGVSADMTDAVLESIIEDPISKKIDHVIFDTIMGRNVINCNISFLQSTTQMVNMATGFFFSLILQEAVNTYVAADQRIVCGAGLLVIMVLLQWALTMFTQVTTRYAFGRLGGTGVLTEQEVNKLVEKSPPA